MGLRRWLLGAQKSNYDPHFHSDPELRILLDSIDSDIKSLNLAINSTNYAIENTNSLESMRERSRFRNLKTKAWVAGILAIAVSIPGFIMVQQFNKYEPHRNFEVGRIGVMVENANDEIPLEVAASFDVAETSNSSVELVVTKRFDHGPNPKLLDRDIEIGIFVCGRLRQGLNLWKNNVSEPLQFKRVKGSPIIMDSRLGDRSDCRYTPMVLRGLQLRLFGKTEVGFESISGVDATYSFPPVVTSVTAEIIDGKEYSPLPPGSKIHVAARRIREDFEMKSSRPYLDPGATISWTTDIGKSNFAPDEYLVYGPLEREMRKREFVTFVAGALVGLSGALVITFIESVIGVSVLRRLSSTDQNMS